MMAAAAAQPAYSIVAVAEHNSVVPDWPMPVASCHIHHNIQSRQDCPCRNNNIGS
jgi:hypothetical protein